MSADHKLGAHDQTCAVTASSLEQSRLAHRSLAKKQQGMAALWMASLLAIAFLGYVAIDKAGNELSAYVLNKDRLHLQLKDSVSSLLAFAAWHGRLPCPAEQVNGSENCAATAAAWLPSLGTGAGISALPPIRYRVSPALNALSNLASYDPTASVQPINLLDLCQYLSGGGTSFVAGAASAGSFAAAPAFTLSTNDLSFPNAPTIEASISIRDLYQALMCESQRSIQSSTARVLPYGTLAETEKESMREYTGLFGTFRTASVATAALGVYTSIGGVTNAADVIAQSAAYLAACLGFCPQFAAAIGIDIPSIAVGTTNLVADSLLLANTLAYYASLWTMLGIHENTEIWPPSAQKTLASALEKNNDIGGPK